MKNLLITSAVLAMLASPSLAFELGKGVGFDSTVKAHYSFENTDFTASYKGEVNYFVADGLKAYVDSTIDLQNIDFAGANLGLEYIPASFNKITFNAETQFDADLRYTDTVVYAELKF